MTRRLALLLGLAVCGIAGPLQAAESVDLVVPQMAAERHGLTRAWFTQLPMDGSRSDVTYIVQQGDMLFVQTSLSMVHAIDTETGRLVWSQQVGNPALPTQRLGVNDRAVAV